MQDFSFDVLVGSIREIDAKFVSSAVKAVNVSLTLRNWCIGAYISEFELHGSNRAGYGDRLLFSVAKDLQSAGLKRCDQRELQRYVLFYRRYPNFGSLLPEAVKDQYLSICSADGDGQNTYIGGIEETVSPKFRISPEKLITSLSFSHLSEIMEIENPVKRLFYEIECIKGCWSVRELKRQIASMYFERSGLSRDKEALSCLANEGAEISFPLMAIRDPYVFEFLGLKPAEVMDESVFEVGTLEDGAGFCAVVGKEQIAKHDFILTPNRYVGQLGVEDNGEPFEKKMERLMGELAGLFGVNSKAELEIKKKLGGI